MQKFYKLLGVLFCCLLCMASQNLLAQPPNDECAGAIDISAAFTGACGDVLFNGPYDTTGSTPGANDPPEPNGDPAVCPDGENDTNLFGDESEIWENSVWYTFTVPDLYGDGSPVNYSIWTSDGSFDDDCGINPNAILGLNNAPDIADTQVAMYEGPDCPNSSTGECDYYAANEDLFVEPPWISGWLSLAFTPGVQYYMGVDGWNGNTDQGEFCLTVVVCGVECGDAICAPVEGYCDCDDCRDQCTFSDFVGIDHREDGNFRAPDFEGNIFVCAESVLGFSSENVYMGILASETETCDGTAIDLPLELSVGSLLGTDEDGLDTLSQGFFSYVELTPEDIAAGSITITSSSADGIGNDCTSSVTINFADYPQVTEPYCNLTCFAGGVDTSILTSGVTTCEDQTFTLNTDGLEQLDLPCDSEDGYVYAWRVLTDLYGAGDFAVVTSWQPLGSNPTIDPNTFFIDEFGYAPPYFTPGYALTPLDPYTGEPRPIRVQGAAICFNADGSIADGCTANNEGFPSSQVNITYLPAGDAGCENMPPPVIMGCTNMDSCNYNPDATEDDGSCTELDCAGECGGAATEGTPCTDANGMESSYAADCSCPDAMAPPPPPPGPSNNDICEEAPDISSAFTEECEIIGPFDQTDATLADAEPPVPGCFLDAYDGTTWYKFTVPDNIGGGAPTGYSISTGAFEDCPTTNPLGGGIDVDTQIAIYEGDEGCPGPTSVPIACNDDIATTLLFPEVSSLDLNLTPGNTYYIMVETFTAAALDGLDGEFCFYIAPTAKPTCVNCGDGSCTEVFGEDFSSCPEDCPCIGEFLANDIDPATGFPTLILDFKAVCPEVVSASGDGLYILFTLDADNVAVGDDNITYTGSTLSASVGTIYNFVFGGEPILPTTNEATRNVTLLYLTQAEVDAGVAPVITFVDETGSCTITTTLDANLTEPDCMGGQPCMTSSATLALSDGSNTTSICYDDGVDDPVDVNITEEGSGDASAWVITDLTGTILALPDGPPFVLDGAGEGECLIWLAHWCGDLSQAPAVGANATEIIDASDDAVLSNPITVVRESCPATCEDPAACNTGEEGACDFGNTDCTDPCNPVEGCTDDTACNYNPDACVDDGLCDLGNADCTDPCNPVEGCTDDSACNYNPDACVDDGSCDPGNTDCADPCNPVEGCTDETACNYNPDACIDDGSCEMNDCEGTCGGTVGPGSDCVDADGNAGTYNGSCECEITVVEGCTEMDACNFDPNANQNDGSCTFPEDNFDCNGNCLIEEDCAGVCGGDAVEDCNGGCNGDAVPGSACTDANGNPSTYQSDCSCPEATPICEDADACNTGEEGDCQYPDTGFDCEGNCIDGDDCTGECGGSATPGTPCTDANGNESTYAEDCSCPNIVVPTTCDDPDACNTGEEGECQYPDPGFDCDGNCIEETDCNNECGGSALPGTPCTAADGSQSSYLDDCSCPGGPAPCGSDAGTISFSSGGEYSSRGFICDGGTVTVEAADFLTTDGQEVTYVFHEDGIVDSNDALQNILSTGNSFTNDGIGKKEIFVTAYGATVAAGGGPDFTDNCLTYSNTLTITLLNPIEITVDENCEAEKGEFTYAFNATGGLPECVPSTSFAVLGDFGGDLSHGQSQTVGPIQDAQSYSISVTDENGCTAEAGRTVNCTKLPIELISFEGEALAEGNLLKWVTAAEIENDYYTIESSTDGNNFSKMATVKGNGTTSKVSNYIYLDRTATKGITYYRLKQIDFDGTTVQVGIVAIERGETSFNITDLYPIPTSDYINVDFMAPEQSGVSIEVYDLIGKTIETFKTTSTGSNLYKINVSNYPVGVYFISINSNDHMATKKFVVE